MAAYRPRGALFRVLPFAFLGISAGVLASCGHVSGFASRDRDCMARVMYFESIRSSDEGMLAVGTVVMNRVESGKYPNTVCGVVGQKNQFAPGVLSKPVPTGKSRDRAYRIADQVLAGKRHRGVGKAMFFHTAGRTYGFTNMHYVAVAGGNAFYERKPSGRSYIPRTVIAQAGPRDSISAPGGLFGRMFASNEVQESARAAPPRPAPLPQPAPVMIAAAPATQAPAGYVPPPEPLFQPMSIESLILASNGF